MGFGIKKAYWFACDDCQTRTEFLDIKAARADGWAISKDRKKCYCRKCAELRRNVGRNGGKKIATIESAEERKEDTSGVTLAQKIFVFMKYSDYRTIFDPERKGFGLRVLALDFSTQLEEWLLERYERVFPNGYEKAVEYLKYHNHMSKFEQS